MHADNKASNKHPVVLTAHLDPGLSRLDQGGTVPTLPPAPSTAGPAVPPAPEPAGTRTGV